MKKKPTKEKIKMNEYPPDHFMDYLCERGFLEKKDGQLVMKWSKFSYESLQKDYKNKYL